MVSDPHAPAAAPHWGGGFGIPGLLAGIRAAACPPLPRGCLSNPLAGGSERPPAFYLRAYVRHRTVRRMLDHAALPTVADAKLPTSYQTARDALRDCENVDECAAWENKAQAMASYARMAGDKTLEHLAMRIRARAIRRAAEIWKLLESESGGNRGNQYRQPPPRGELPPPKQEAQRAAGLSDKQVETMVAVGKVPEDVFEAAVESDNPPSKTALAKMGREAVRPPPDPQTWLKGRTPQEFNAALHFAGDIIGIARTLEKLTMETIAFLDDEQIAEIREAIPKIDAVTDTIMARMMK